MTENLRELGDLLRRQRELVGKSARETARQADITAAYLQFLEQGLNPKTGKPSKPSVKVLDLLAQALGIENSTLRRLAGHPEGAPRRPDPSVDLASIGGRTARRSEWDIPDQLLIASGSIRDILGRDVRLTRLEKAVIDTRTFQKLRQYLHLPFADLVFPGATHSRFSHALGAVSLSDRIFSAVVDSAHPFRSEKEFAVDVVEAWGTGLSTEKAIERARILTRLSALLHLIGTFPFEECVFPFLPPRHERAQTDLDAIFREAFQGLLPDEVSAALLRDVSAVLIPISSDKTETRPPPGFIRDIVTGPFSACWIDSLLRDALATGIPTLGSFERVLPLLSVSRDESYPERLVLGLRKGSGAQRLDVASELGAIFLNDFTRLERVLNHPTRLSAQTMMSSALACWFAETFLEMSDPLWTYLGGRQSRALIPLIKPEYKVEFSKILYTKGEETILSFISDDERLEIPQRSRLLAERLRERRLLKFIKTFDLKQSPHVAQAWMDRGLEALGDLPELESVPLIWTGEDLQNSVQDILVDDGEVTLPYGSWNRGGIRKRQLIEASRRLGGAIVFGDPIVSRSAP